MALLDHELARRTDGRIEFRAAPVRIRWDLDDLVTADGHRVHCAFACTVRVLDSTADRTMLAEAFLTQRAALSIQDVVSHFLPAIRSALDKAAVARDIETWCSQATQAAMVASVRQVADAVAFACGLELVAPFSLEVDSPSYRRMLSERANRAVVEQRVAGQVEHLQRAAEMLESFQALRQRAPELSAGQVLERLSPADRGAMLQTVTMAAAHQVAAAPLWAVAGPYLVRIDPHDAAAAESAAVVELTSSPGPLRSVQPARIDDRPMLLIGARGGVLVVDPDHPDAAVTYTDPDSDSPLGFNSVAFCNGRIWAAHSQAGIVAWQRDAADAPQIRIDPAQIAAATESTTELSGARNLRWLDAQRMLFSSDRYVLRIDADGNLFRFATALKSPVVAILPDRDWIDFACEDGTLCRHSASSAPSAESVPEGDCQQRRLGAICAAGSMPWLDGRRLLLATADGPIVCCAFEDQLVTQYNSVHRGLRMVAASPSTVAAAAADRQRLILWNSWDGRQPAAELHLTARLKHRLADISFGV